MAQRPWLRPDIILQTEGATEDHTKAVMKDLKLRWLCYGLLLPSGCPEPPAQTQQDCHQEAQSRDLEPHTRREGPVHRELLCEKQEITGIGSHCASVTF